MPLMANAEAGENEAPIGMVCSGGTAVIKDLGRYVLFGPRTWSTSWMDLSSVRWMESGAVTRCDLAPNTGSCGVPSRSISPTGDRNLVFGC